MADPYQAVPKGEGAVWSAPTQFAIALSVLRKAAKKKKKKKSKIYAKEVYN